MSTSNSKWYFSDGQNERGPFDPSVIDQLRATGVIQPSFMLRKEDEKEWVPVGSVNTGAEEAEEPAYFLALGGTTTGPYPFGEIRSRWERGEIAPATLCWTDGMSDWMPVNGILSVEPPRSIAPAITSRTTPNTGPLNPVPLIACVSVATLSFLLMIWNAANHTGEPDYVGGKMPALIFGVSFVGSLVTWAVVHFQAWRSIPATLRSVSPATAVGLMFVPVYNLYWGFVTWPRLWKALQEWRAQSGLKRDEDPKETAIMLAVIPCLFILLVTIQVAPRLRVFGLVAFAGLLCEFYWRISRSIREAQTASGL